jgi:hypothetical protein
MATSYSDVFELFLASVKDNDINKLYAISVETAEIYMTPFLIKAIPNFLNCKKDLEDRNDTSRTFNITLNTDEKVTLSNLMTIEWLTQEINDINQFRLHLQDQDFKTFSEERNLDGKKKLKYDTLEDIRYQIKQYDLKNIDWSTLG